MQKVLNNLYEKWANEPPISCKKLPESGSSRQYFRIFGKTKSAIGVINNDCQENKAFISFSQSFKKLALNVPKIYIENIEKNVYLQEDLGDTTLFKYLTEERKSTINFSEKLTQIYKNILQELLKFQIKAAKEIDYSVCYPRSSFDQQSMQWDLNYFKYYFLKLAEIPFDEQALENDFDTFINYLLSTETDYFLYRDFQSRNIMLHNDVFYFIDYQGGRKGALAYDLASLLYDAKANIPESKREELLKYYIAELQKHTSANEKTFTEIFYAYVLIRIMQAMGAYGFRGFFQKKIYFLQSIPYALKNLDTVLKKIKLPIQIPHLIGVLEAIVKSEKPQKLASESADNKTLTVKITSFSYKKGIPEDLSGNGGGFVFDCRFIHNPGRYERYKKLTGKDKEVIDFFEKETDIKNFLSQVFNIVQAAVNTYKQREFKHLMVNFGCTGGQHRSVYCAEKLKNYLENQNNNNEITIEILHREQNLTV